MGALVVEYVGCVTGRLRSLIHEVDIRSPEGYEYDSGVSRAYPYMSGLQLLFRRQVRSYVGAISISTQHCLQIRHLGIY